MSKKEQQPLSVELNHKLIKWCSNTTSHGLPNIVNNKKSLISRVMWTLFFMASLGYCIYIITNSLVNYFKYETNIAVKLGYESPTVFPCVTICNVNPFNEFYARDYIRNITEDYNEFECFKNTVDDGRLEDCFKQQQGDGDTTKILDVFIDKLKRVVANDKRLNEETKSFLGYFLDNDMLISCYFNGIECNEENFTLTWNNQYGNCYTFNNGKRGPLLLTSEQGRNHGLKIELSVRPVQNDTIFSYRKGLVVLVHNKSETPFTSDTGIIIPTGFETYIGIDRTFINKLPHPYSDCLMDLKRHNNYSTTIFSYFDDLNVTYYDQEFCYSLCYQDKLVDECGCCDIITPRIRNSSYCLTDNELSCLKEFKLKFSIIDLNKLCDSTCLQQCIRREYRISSNMATYPTNTYLRYLASDFRYFNLIPRDSSELKEFGREAILKLIVNYENLYYTTINENASVNFEDLLGNIGGQLGLFIGISFLSFVEIIELLSELFIICLKRCRIKQKQGLMPSNQQQYQPYHITRNYPNRYLFL